MPRSRSDTAFERVYVDYVIRGGARVTWEMRDDFTDPEPWEFQLQVSAGGDPSTYEWENVGLPVTNTFQATDDIQRQYSKSLRAVYRVVLTTSVGTYESEEAEVLGKLTTRQWLQARAIIRRMLLVPNNLSRIPGVLLKRKTHGTDCTCIDPITKGILNSNCTACNGTGKVTGYWKGAEDMLFELAPEGDATRRSNRGTVHDVSIVGMFVGIPFIRKNDIWVDSTSDRRYFVARTSTKAEMNRVPLVVGAELRLIPFSNIVYTIDPDEGL